MNESLYPFVNHTTYDIKALSALNRLAEASVRKEKSRRTKSLCWLLGVVGLVGGAYCYPHQNLVGSLLLLYGVILLLEEFPAALLPAAAPPGDAGVHL